MVGDAMKLGPLIKYYRTQKGIKQKELATGICSIPHLSKIENNSKEANKETITFLLKRLNVDFEDINEKEALIRTYLAELNEKINYFFKKEVDQTFQRLQDWEDIIPFSSYLYTYELYKYRYLLFKGMLSEAEGQRQLLNKLRKNFSQHETYLFNYYNAVFLIMGGHFSKADEMLEILFSDDNNEIFPGEVLYHRALVKSALEESGHAIHFGKMALQSFMNQHNFKRILHTLMLLGINYTHSKIYKEALACFEHLIRNAELLKDSTLLPHVLHNMGFLQKQIGNEKKALSYFEKSLTLQEKDTLHYMVSLHAFGEVNFYLKETEKAQDTFQKLSLMARKLENRKFEVLANYFLMALETPEKALGYLESKVVPCLEESKEHRDNLIGFYKLLSEYYKNIGRYEEAVYYIEKTK